MTRQKAESRRQKAEKRGAVLIMALVALALIAALGGTLIRWAAMEHKLLRRQEEAGQARWLAQAGIERAAAQLARDGNYPGEVWEVSAADLPSGEAARVHVTATPVEDEHGRYSVEVDIEYPLDGGVDARAHKEVVLQTPAKEAS